MAIVEDCAMLEVRVLNLVIENCNQCPYKRWSHYIQEFVCAKEDKLLFYDEYCEKGKIGIPGWCPLSRMGIPNESYS